MTSRDAAAGARAETSWILRDIGCLLTMDGPDEGPTRAGRQARLFRQAPRASDALLWQAGRVQAVGPFETLARSAPRATVLSAGGRLVTPGLADAHTHLLYAGHRADEVALRARGASYLDILAAGGGILSTVRATRAASDRELLDSTRRRLGTALAAGTTAIEIKTGYDLTPAGELRLLRLIRQLAAEGPQHIAATFLGAHALPPEAGGQVVTFLEGMAQVTPELKGMADFVDLFCEPGVFDQDVSRPYLEGVRAAGLPLKIHVDELQDAGGAAFAASLGAVTADHLAFTGSAGIAALARSQTLAVLLPGTAGYLHQGGMANGRAMLDQGLLAAIASDGNPGSSPTSVLGPLMPWAAAWLHLTPEEVWAGVTRVGALAMGRPDLGQLAIGHSADLVIWDTDDYRIPCAQYGVNLVEAVYVAGRAVHPVA